MLYHNHRQEPYFSYLKSGQKTIEGRLLKGKYAKIKIGDQILVKNIEETEEILVEVMALNFYPSFRDLVKTEKINKLLPNISTVEEGIQIYKQFYNPEEEQIYGVVAIHIRLI